AKDAFEHLDILRQRVQESAFYFRGGERRSEARVGGTERRKSGKKKFDSTPLQQPSGDLSVTVSIGVAEPSTRYRQPGQVIHAADKALYCAKHNGRNRVELASATALKVARPKKARSSKSSG